MLRIRNFSPCLVAWIFATTSFARILNVPDDNQTIQAAVNASQNGDTVLVADGVFDENVDFSGRAILLASHLILDGDRAHISQTIIDAGGRDCGVAFNHAEGHNSILQGFTVRNGVQNFGGGIDCQRNCAPQLLDLIVTGNHANTWGGGIYIALGASPQVRRTIIRENHAQQGGGVASYGGAAPEFSEVLFSNNSADEYGGGVYGARTGFSFDHVAFIDNQVTYYGAATAFEFSANLSYRNVTFIGNLSAQHLCGAAFFFGPEDEGEVGGCSGAIVNSVFFRNTEPQFQNYSAGADGEYIMQFRYCDIENGNRFIGAHDLNKIDIDETNFAAEPMFNNEQNGDYTPAIFSPLVDSGDPDAPEDPDGTRSDVGAYYFDQRLLPDHPVIEVEFNGQQAPQQIDWDQVIAERFRGGDYVVPILISNGGGVPLDVELGSNNADYFHAEPAQIELNARSQSTISLHFTPPASGNYSETLTLHANDPDHQVLEITLTGSASEPPALEVEPDQVEADLPTAAKLSQAITLRNPGNAVLQWEATSEIVNPPENHDPGQVLTRFDNPPIFGTTITWDGELIWGFRQINNGGVIFAFDPETGENVASYSVNYYVSSMAFNGENLVLDAYNGEQTEIVEFNRRGEEIGRRNSPNNGHSYNIQMDSHRRMLVRDYQNPIFHLYDYDTFDEIKTWQYSPEDLRIGSIASFAWVPAQPGGEIWACVETANGYKLVQLDLHEDGTVSRVQEVQTQAESWFGVMHDGRNLWIADGPTNHIWYVIDDGIDEQDWIDIYPTLGDIAINAESAFDLGLNAAHLGDGEHQAVVHIGSNIPGQGAEIPVTLTVAGAPQMVIHWAKGEAENQIDWSDYYNNLFATGVYPIPITIHNHGVTTLNIAHLDFGQAPIVCQDENLSIAPGGRQDLSLVFQPQEAGDYNTTLTIASNDPDDSTAIHLIAHADAAPAISASPDCFNENVASGEDAHLALTLRNDGGASLAWNIFKEITAEGQGRRDRDAAHKRTLRNVSASERNAEPNIHAPAMPSRDNPGDVLGGFNAPTQQSRAIVMVEDNLWAADYQGNGIYVLNPVTSEIIRQFDGGFSLLGLTYDGNNIYGLKWSGGYSEIAVYNRQGEIIGNIAPRLGTIYAIASDYNGHLICFVGGGQEMECHVWDIAGAREIGSFSPIHITNLRGYYEAAMVWVPRHTDGQLTALIADGNNSAYFVRFLITQDWHASEVDRIQLHDGSSVGPIAHDGYNLWMTRLSAIRRLEEIDDGVAEPLWLNIDPQSGELEANAQTDVNLTFISDHLLEGDYGVLLRVRSEDPANPDIQIPVSVTIAGFGQISAGWRNGLLADHLDWNQANPDVYIGYPAPLPLTLRNLGTANLHISDISFSSEAFSADQHDITVAPDDSAVVNLSYTAPNGNLNRATMTIVSNDPDHGALHIPVSGRGIVAPEIHFVGGEINEERIRGEGFSTNFQVSNVGQNTLRWHIQVEEPEQFRYTPGQLLRRYEIPGHVPSGMAWDGEYMWLNDGGHLSAFDPWSGTIVRQINGGWSGSLAFDGHNFICMGNGGAMITEFYVIDRDGNRLQTVHVDRGYNSLTANRSGWVLLKINMGSELEIYDMNQGRSIGSIPYAGELNRGFESMVWVDSQPDAPLWLGGQGGIMQTRLGQQGGLEEVQSFDWNSDQDDVALAHDGENLWHGMGREAALYVHHDGIYDHPWLSADPDSGALQRNAATDVVVTLASVRLEAGERTAIIHVLSNDPAHPDIEVPVTFNVIDGPGLASIPICGPRGGAEPVALPDAVVGSYPTEELITLINTRRGTLRVSDVQNDHPDEFSTTLQAGSTLDWGDSLVFSVQFHPTVAGQRTGRLTLQTNAVDIGEGDQLGVAWFDLTGNALGAPRLGLDPDPQNGLSVIADGGNQAEQRSLDILNQAAGGSASLDFHLRTLEPGHQRHDATTRSLRSVSRPAGAVRRDNLGDTLGSYDPPYNYTNSMAWDGEKMWGGSYSDRRLWAINPHDGEVVINMEVDDGPIGLAFDGQLLWVYLVVTHQFAIYDPNGQLQETIAAPFDDIRSITSDQERYLFLNRYQSDSVYVMDLNSRQIVNRFHLPEQPDQDIYMNVLTWVPGHPDGQLWYIRGMLLKQTHVSPNWNCEAVQSINLNEWNLWGLAHDGVNLWYGGIFQPWRVIDDGIVERNPLSWLGIEPSSGSVEAGSRQAVTLTFYPNGLDPNAAHEGDLIISTNAPDALEMTIPLHFEIGNGNLAPRHFTGFTQTQLVHTLHLASAEVNSEPIHNGYEIGVFTPAGTLAGGVVWRASEGAQNDLTAYGDDPATEVIEGFSAGDTMVFKMWDDFTGGEIAQVQAESLEGDLVWSENSESTVRLSSELQQEFRAALHSGWNILSLNVTPGQNYWLSPGGPDVLRMICQFREDPCNPESPQHLVLMKDEEGRFVSPHLNFCCIPAWNLTRGYQVLVDQTVNVQWTGSRIPAQREIPVSAGWNIIPYYPDYSLSVSSPDFYAVGSIAEHVVIAKDAAGQFMVPHLNFSNMYPWTPGQGYQIKLDQDVTLTYPLQDDVHHLAGSGIASPGVVHWPPLEPAMTNMSLLVCVFKGLTAGDGDQVAAFGTDGAIAGVGTVAEGKCGLAIWGDDAATAPVEGLSVGEAFTLKMWDAKQDAEIDLTANVMEGVGLVFKANDLVAVTAIARVAIPDNFYLSQNYPNPFNGVTRIAFGLPQNASVRICVYDISGRLAATLVDGQLTAGIHAAVWNADAAPAGVYLVKMEANGFSSVKKLMLVK